MVNTFLTSTNYAQSAAFLNSQRLGKNRVESYQILGSLLKFKYLSDLLSMPLPSDPYLRYDWFRSLIETYKNSDYIVYENGPNNFNAFLKTEILEKIPSGRAIKFGFALHPCVLAWCGYEDSLMEYIDAHIYEWTKRGYKNTMTIYNVKSDRRPPWTYDADFIIRHRSMLLQKELERNEKPWYVHNKLFVDAGTKLNYFWPYTHKTSGGTADSQQRYKKGFTLLLDPRSKNESTRIESPTQ